VMSHELRTPLTALAGYAELLDDEVFGPLSEQQHGALARMRASTDLLAGIVDEILGFARLEAGKTVVEAHPCTVQEIVRATHAVLEPLARDKQLALDLRLPSSRVSLVTDADMTRRILVNLGANAVKFTEQGRIELEASATDDDVRFVVRDTGVGIAEYDLPRLFQPFTQLDGSLTRRHGGTGLGLYISRRLAGMLGGRIEVSSTLGAGSAFTLILPRN